MAFTDITDPSDTWTDVAHISRRHTYGAEYGESTRIVMGDNVRIGGSILGLADVTDPSDTWVDG